MIRVLLTGGSGFLGHYLLQSAPSEITGWALFHRNPLKLQNPGGFQGVFFDLNQEDWSQLEAFCPHVILHTAAMASADLCEEQPTKAHQINVKVTARLAQLARQSDARLIFLSSDLVFDGERGGYLETDLPQPRSVYGKTKREAEIIVLAEAPNAVVVRGSLFYGKALGGRASFTETLLEQIRAGQKVYGFTDQYRTPLAVSELAKALWELSVHPYRGVLNLAGPERLSRYEMGRIACECLGLPTNLLIPMTMAELPAKVFRPRDCSLNSALAQKLLQTSFSAFRPGMQEVIQHWEI